MADLTQVNGPQGSFKQRATDFATPKLILTFAAGLNENQSPDVNEASSGYNFELGARSTKLIPRAPYDKVTTAPNASPITGIMQLITRTNTKTTIYCSGTNVYKYDGTTHTLVGTVTSGALLRDSHWGIGGEYLVITDLTLTNVVKMWDGTTFQNLPTGLGATSFYAKYSVVYLNRVWFFNVTAGSATPHLMVASAFENPQSLNITNRGGPTNTGGAGAATFPTGLEAFYLLTPDLKAINGVAVFQQVLIISTTDGLLYKLTGTDANTFQFVPFYVGSCAVGTESIVNIGNDVAYVRKGGNIDLLSSTQNYGEVRANDISRWIPTTAAALTTPIACYDQTNQKVFFFTNNKVVVLFKDILFGAQLDPSVSHGLSPWSVYTTAATWAFNTSCAKYMQAPNASTAYNVYVGDSVGNIYTMTGSGTGDGGTLPIDVKRKTRLLDVSVIQPFPYMESVMFGKVQYRRKTQFASDFSLTFDWSDEFVSTSATVSLHGATTGTTGTFWSGSGYWGATGGSYWSDSSQTLDTISHQTFSPTGKGAGFYLTVQCQSTQNWQVDQIELY